MTDVKYNTDTKEVMEQFISDLVNLEVEKTSINEKIKELKADYKEEGLPVGLIVKCFNKIKKSKKMTDSERFEEDAIETLLSESQVVDEALLKL